MQITFLLGGNQGDTIEILHLAEQQLCKQIGHIVSKSSYYETEAWGFDAEQNFVNQIIICETQLSPVESLDRILEIEHQLGRVRKPDGNRYSSRPIDIDIIYCEQAVINSERLVVPHPRLHLRRFALVPLCELMPDFVHPILLRDNKSLLADCSDNLKVEKILLPKGDIKHHPKP